MESPRILGRSLFLATIAAAASLSACSKSAGAPGGGSGTTGTGAVSGSGAAPTTGDPTSGGGGDFPACPSYLNPPACHAGDVQPCYEGDPGTLGTGSCHAGTRTCPANAFIGSSFGACEGQGLPAPATCASPTEFGCGPAPQCGAPRFQVSPVQVGGAPVGGTAVTIDPQGDIFAAYSAQQSSAVVSLVVVKIDPAGHTLWSKTFTSDPSPSSSAAGAIHAIAAGADGRLILVGDVGSTTVSFGGAALGGAGQSAFVVALDASGGHLWSKGFAAGGTTYSGYASGAGVTLDGAGNLYVVGSFGISSTIPAGSVTLDLGGGPLGGVGNGTGFVVELDASGNHVWSTTVGGALGGSANAVALDGAGDVFVTGSSTYATSAPSAYGGPCLYPAMLLASYDGSGVARWTRTFGSAVAGGVGTGIVAGSSGDLFVVGTIGAALDLGGGLLGGPSFAARFDPAGAHVWSMSLESSVTDHLPAPAGLGLDGAGNLVALGGGLHLLKVRPDGIPFIHQPLAGAAAITPDTARAAAIGAAGDVVLSGSSQGTAFVQAFDP